MTIKTFDYVLSFTSEHPTCKRTCSVIFVTPLLCYVFNLRNNKIYVFTMWPCKPYQRELNWTESFPAVLGSYIYLPELTVLWGNPVLAPPQKSSLYQFSARSEKYSVCYCSKGNLRLIDFRYAAVILSDIQATFGDTELNISKPYTPETVATMCMHMKELANPCEFGYVSSIIDGILIPTTHGNHIVLFDLNTVEPCIRKDPPMYLGEDVEYAVPPDLTPLRIASITKEEYCEQLFVIGAQSSNPIECMLPEGSIQEFSHSSTIQIKEWHSVARLELVGMRHPNFLLLYPDIADMSALVYNDIKWSEPKSFLPVYGSFIKLPERTVLWRGYDTLYPALGDRPVYFGEKEVAESYASTSDTHTLGLFATTKPLKLLDIRFMKILLTDLLNERTGNAVLRTTVAFGLCSFYHQLRLMITLYKDIIHTDPGYNAMKSMLNTNSILEQPGVRVAETSNDGWVMTFLGEVFDGVADGFIAPKLFTPYQVHTNNHLHPEIIVFNPRKSGITQLTSVPRTVEISIPYLINQQFPSPITLRSRGMETTYIARYGGSRHDFIPTIPAIEAFNDELNRKNLNAVNLYREAVREGKKLRKKVVFSV